jgi:CRISPR-associated protein Cas1
MISRPARLRREHFSLAIEQEETVFVPFEDIAVIVLNHREINLTHPLLSACAEYGISLFSTGDNHQPNGVFLPYLQHSRATRMLRLQLDITKPAAKQAWAAIIRHKIANQARCLTFAKCGGVERLESYVRRVRSGDPENCEALASSHYFSRLFGIGFHRNQGRWINAALDYGYAVLRGTIARGLVAHGLLPSLGLFHASEQNAFNLADDLIEPFRPIIDLHVVGQPLIEERELLPTDKTALVALLNVDVIMPRGTMSTLSAIEQCIESFVRFYEGAAAETLELPVLAGLRQNIREH